MRGTRDRYTYSTTLTWEHPDDDEQDVSMEIECVFTVDPGYPARGPSYSSGGEPGEPASVEDVEIRLIDGRPVSEWDWAPFGDSLRGALDALADKLVDEEHHLMLGSAGDDDAADYDAAMEARWEDDRLWGDR